MRYIVTNESAPVDFGAKEGTVERVLQNVHNLLMLKQGEVPYDRLRGMAARLTGQPLGLFREDIAKEIDRVLMWEPRAEMVSVEVVPEADGTIFIRAVIDIS